jgi:hypothetical protein
MKTLLVIVAVHALLIGFGLLLAGIGSLAAPSDAEIEASRQEFENERKKGFWRYVFFCLGQYGSGQTRGFSLAVSHWPERPEGRWMIYAGVGCLIVAAGIGYHFGVFDS